MNEIRIENYASILSELRPALSKYIEIWKKKFNLERDDVESWTYQGLFDAVRTFNKEQKTCKFYSYMITIIKRKLLNEARRRYMNKNKIFQLFFTEAPCKFCETAAFCKKECRKLHQFKLSQLNLNALKQTEDDTLDKIVRQDYSKKLLKTFLKNKPAFRNMVQAFSNTLNEGVSEQKVIPQTIEKLSRKNGISKAYIYKSIGGMQKELINLHHRMLNS